MFSVTQGDQISGEASLRVNLDAAFRYTEVKSIYQSKL